jgi:hypothetical protein
MIWLTTKYTGNDRAFVINTATVGYARLHADGEGSEVYSPQGKYLFTVTESPQQILASVNARLREIHRTGD